jgi:hypothetical protein
MGSAEACCERVGSLMKRAWFPERGADVGAIMDSVLLDEAQVKCVGTARDEDLVASVSQILYCAGKKPTLRPRTAQARLLRGMGSSSSSVHYLRLDSQRDLELSGRNPHPGHSSSESEAESDGLELGTQTPSYTAGGIAEHRKQRRRIAGEGLKNQKVDEDISSECCCIGDASKT